MGELMLFESLFGFSLFGPSYGDQANASAEEQQRQLIEQAKWVKTVRGAEVGEEPQPP
jgi:hypothetical protein